LVKEGFTVLAYSSDDPRAAVRIKEAGAASVMPAGSDRLRPGHSQSADVSLCLELIERERSDLSSERRCRRRHASDVTQAMELGADGVLLNTGIATRRISGEDGDRHESRLEAGHLGTRPAAFQEALCHCEQSV